MADKTDLKEKIIEFSLEEGILKEKLPENSKIEFGFNIVYPPDMEFPKKLVVFQPRGKKYISIQIGTQISPEHLKMLDQPKKLLFFEILKRFLITQNLLFHLDINNNRFLISDKIYSDALTMDNYYKTIRKLFNATIFANTLISDIASGKNIIPKSFGNNGTGGDSNIHGRDFFYT